MHCMGGLLCMGELGYCVGGSTLCIGGLLYMGELVDCVGGTALCMGELAPCAGGLEKLLWHCVGGLLCVGEVLNTWGLLHHKS